MPLGLLIWSGLLIGTLEYFLNEGYRNETGKSVGGVLHKALFSALVASVVWDSIWLEIYINWQTMSQGPMNKCSHFTKGRIHPCFAHTPPVIRVVLLQKSCFVQSFFLSTVYWKWKLYIDRTLVLSAFQYSQAIQIFEYSIFFWICCRTL